MQLGQFTVLTFKASSWSCDDLHALFSTDHSRYLFDATHDPTTLVLRPNSFSDLAEHAVLCALPMAAALTSNEYGDSPQASRVVFYVM
jgi:hypothetical protein